MSRRTSIIWTTDKDELQKIIDESSSLCDVLRKLNYKKFSNNCKTLKERIVEDKLCLDKMETNRVDAQNCTNRYTDQEMFKINSNCDSKNIKARILKKNLLEYKCQICGIGNQWNGKKLVLQLDHINGDITDNRLENLRYICPNCHSQTETYAGKKNKKDVEINRCIECGKQIYRTSERCIKCNGKTFHKTNIQEEQLRKLIIEDKLSYVKIGKMFGITDNAIKKRCIRLGIIEGKIIRNIKEHKNYDRIKNQDLFVENGTHERGIIRSRLIRDKLVEYKCQICKINKWNEKDLSLHLDHINGINNDNRLENLRFICSCCDSQTETFAGRNKINLKILKEIKQ